MPKPARVIAWLLCVALATAALVACGGPNPYLEALERDHPVLRDFEPDGATRTERSTRGGTGIQANGQRNASIDQDYIPADGDRSQSAVEELFGDFEVLLEDQGWVLTSSDDEQLQVRGSQGGERRVQLFVRSPRDTTDQFYLTLRLQDRP